MPDPAPASNAELTGIAFELSSARTAPEAPDGRPLIAHLVVNIEYWRYDRPMPRALLPPPHGARSVPDVPNFGWFEYGLRCGLPRIIDLFERLGVPASASMNAGIISAYPQVARAVLATGWEVVAHGMVQRALGAEENEAEVICSSVEAIREFTGAAPRGWLGPGLQQTFSTATLLCEAGIEYVCDWILDDLPVIVATPAGRLLAIPYSLELNDSLLHAVEHYPADELYRRLAGTLATFERELLHGPRIVTLGLHPHLIGVPHRIGQLERCIEMLRAREDVIFMTGSEIADWYAPFGGA